MEKLGNHYLGADFSITSFVFLISIFVFIFYFRKKIFFFFYKTEDLEPFIHEIKNYLKTTYPTFKFDYAFIHGLDESNPDTKKYEIIDTLISQYISKPYKAKVNNPINTSNLWDGYVFFSKPKDNKIPQDWMKRKHAVLDREKGHCQRCSQKVTILKSDLIFIQPLEKNGTYYLENLVVLCKDCSIIEKNKMQPTTDISNLAIKDNLYKFI